MSEIDVELKICEIESEIAKEAKLEFPSLEKLHELKTTLRTLNWVLGKESAPQEY